MIVFGYAKRSVIKIGIICMDDKQQQQLITVEQLNTLSADQNPALVYLASLSSAESRRTMRNALNAITDIIVPDLSRTLPKEAQKQRYQYVVWSALRYQHVQAIRAELALWYAPATTNKILSALRGVLDAAFNLEQLSAEDYQRARQVKNVRGESLPAGRDVKPEELRALIDVCQEEASPAAIRDTAIIGVLYTCGLRRAELVSLTRDNLDMQERKLMVKQAKGRKQRTAYVSGGALAALKSWLGMRGTFDGALFNPILKNGTVVKRAMTAQAVYYILKKRAEQADVPDFSPHDMRRTFVGDLLDRGADIVVVSKLAGHADVKTTARYDRRPEEAKRRAAELLDFPVDDASQG